MEFVIFIFPKIYRIYCFIKVDIEIRYETQHIDFIASGTNDCMFVLCFTFAFR